MNAELGDLSFNETTIFKQLRNDFRDIGSLIRFVLLTC